MLHWRKTQSKVMAQQQQPMKLKTFTANQNRAFMRLHHDNITQFVDDIDTLVIALMEADAKIQELEAKLAKINALCVNADSETAIDD
jgi:hypothetical protein